MEDIKARNIELVDIDSIVPNPKNANKHPPEQIVRLEKLIKYQGMRNPLIISNRTGFLVVGHGRLEACKNLGMKQVPVIKQDFENEAQEYAYLISDNEIARWAELDKQSVLDELQNIELEDVELLGLEEFEIPEVESLDPQSDEDEVPEVEHPITRRGDVWLLGKHRLMCGDSTMIDDVEKLMNGDKADLWIADPPFGVSYCDKNAAVHGGVVKNQHGKEIKSDTKSVEELCPFWRDVATNAYTVTTMEASNYWCACQGSDKMMMMMMMMMDEAGWNIRHELIWVKSSMVFGRSDYHYRHEPIIYGWKKKGKHNWYSDRKQNSVFEFDRPSKSDLHPTTKPVGLFQEFFKNSCKVNGLIFESFGGSGTSIMAATNNSQKCNTMELDEKYCDVIINRWQNYTGKKATLESTGQTYEELKNERIQKQSW